VPIDSGGTITFPPGSLIEGTTVTVESANTPALPEDVVPIGEAFEVVTSSDILQPAFIHLPIPEGVSDPSSLVVYRVTEDGNTTFLIPNIDVDELVAATPGFSVQGIARLSGAQPAAIIGRDSISFGEYAHYSFGNLSPEIISDADIEWRILAGPVKIVESNRVTVIITMNDDITADAKIFAYTSRPIDGKHYYAFKEILLQTLTDPINVSLTTLTTIVNENECIEIKAYANGVLPLTWEWWFGHEDFIGKEPDDVTADSNDTAISLPCQYVDLDEDESYRLHPIVVSVTDEHNQTDIATTTILVRKPKVRLSVDGPRSLAYEAPSVSAQYTATAANGSGSYLYKWPARPQESSHSEGTSAKTVTFDQPGGYILSVIAEDTMVFTDESTDKLKIPITVTGRSLNISVTPEITDHAASLEVDIKDGILIASGKKSHYNLLVHWGDSSESKEIDATSSVSGETVYLMHTYTSAGTYHGSVYVYDASAKGVSKTFQFQVDDDGSDFGYPSPGICPQSLVALSCTADWCGENIWKKFDFDYLYDTGPIIGLYEASCQYKSSNPGEDDIYTAYSLNLDYEPQHPNYNGCGLSTDPPYVLYSDAGFYGFSTRRALQAHLGGYGQEFFQSPEALLGTLLTNAGNAGVGAPCP